MSIQQVKENLEILNQRNQSLIDLANATTGKSDTTLTDGVNSLIDNYGKDGTDTTDATATASDILKDKTAYVVGKKITGTIETFDGSYECSGDSTGGGSLEGLENGYDVMFYDENNDGLAFYSIKQGHTINPPVYACNAWMTEDRQEIIFPYTPSSDISCYAFSQVYADQIYEAYGIDKNTRPYLVIIANDYTKLRLYFAQYTKVGETEITLLSANLLLMDFTELSLSNQYLNDITNIVGIVISGVGRNFSTFAYDINISSALGLYTNFEHNVTCDVISARLDA